MLTKIINITKIWRIGAFFISSLGTIVPAVGISSIGCPIYIKFIIRINFFNIFEIFLHHYLRHSTRYIHFYLFHLIVFAMLHFFYQRHSTYRLINKFLFLQQDLFAYRLIYQLYYQNSSSPFHINFLQSNFK